MLSESSSLFRTKSDTCSSFMVRKSFIVVRVARVHVVNFQANIDKKKFSRERVSAPGWPTARQRLSGALCVANKMISRCSFTAHDLPVALNANVLTAPSRQLSRMIAHVRAIFLQLLYRFDAHVSLSFTREKKTARKSPRRCYCHWCHRAAARSCCAHDHFAAACSRRKSAHPLCPLSSTSSSRPNIWNTSVRNATWNLFNEDRYHAGVINASSMKICLI